MAKHTFYGVTMSFGIVSTYYPITPIYPLFDRFVFQQMIDDVSKADNDYILIVYAVDVNGVILNSYQLPKTITLPTKPAKKKAQFANMKLDVTGLKQLYPTSVPPVTSDMSIYPTGYYPGTDYIVYTAETDINLIPLVKVNVPLKPSPPY